MEVIVRAIRQSGIAPKVKIPAGVLFALGVVLVALSFVIEDSGDLLEVGLALIGASGVTFGIGTQAPPGDVVVSPAAVATAESARTTRSRLGDESGQSWVTFLIALAALCVIIYVVVALT